MGIRRSYGRNKKSNRPTDAATVERQDLVRRAANVRSRFDATRRAPAPASDPRDPASKPPSAPSGH